MTIEAKAGQPAQPEESETMRTKTSKAKARGKARAAVKGKTKKATSAGKEPREGSKLEAIGKLLARPAGCTVKQVLAATGWPSVSMPQQARALGIELRKEKGADGATVYRAA